MSADEELRVRAITAAYEAEMEKLRADNAYLRKENASLWESVHELQAMVNRAHTGSAA